MNLNFQDIDWKSVLIKRYRNYQMDEIDVMVFFVSDNILAMENDVLLTQDILADYMAASRDVIDQSLSKLLKNKMIIVNTDNNGVHFSTTEFKNRLYQDVIRDLVLAEKIGKSTTGLSHDLAQSIEELVGRPLSPLEREHISNWIKEGADDGMIKEACAKSITRSGLLSMKKADNLIMEMNRSRSIDAYGVSTVDEDTRKRQELQDFLNNSDWTYHGNGSDQD